jgi:hypothetical protein
MIIHVSHHQHGLCSLCSLLPPSFEAAFLTIAITNISVPLLESLICVSNSRSARRTSTKLIQESVSGWLIMSSVLPLSFLKNQKLTQSTHLASTTSITLNNSQCAHSQYMPSSTFLTKSDRWDHAGQHGLSSSRDNVATFSVASRVDKICMQIWINTLLIYHSSGKSRFCTILLMSSLENLPRSPLCKWKGLKIVSHASVHLPWSNNNSL